MTSPENLPREKGSEELPEGAVENPDGSYSLPNETIEIPEEETEEQRAERQRLLREGQADQPAEGQTTPESVGGTAVAAPPAPAAPAEQAAVTTIPREQGTVVPQDGV